MSAYACEPGKGSEPEVGWQWALQMAKRHDVTVLTRVNNRRGIEAALQRFPHREPVPEFVYHDLGPAWLWLKKKMRLLEFYYIVWQRSARARIAQLHATKRFDLLHHVTFAAFRYATAVSGHGVPSVWGPVGGISYTPFLLLPWRPASSLKYEALRTISNHFARWPVTSSLGKLGRAHTLTLASAREMRETFARMGVDAPLFPTIGLRTASAEPRERPTSTGELRLLFVGGMVAFKGPDLGVEALARSGIKATYTLVGSGKYEEVVRSLTARLGLADRVVFKGHMPRDEVLGMYGDYDVFLFPSLHDSGGYVVIEAMMNELPVICLDAGGPAVAVQAGCGTKVPVGRRKDVIAGLARALVSYDQNRALVATHGRAARQRVIDYYDWDRKAEQMDGYYRQALAR